MQYTIFFLYSYSDLIGKHEKKLYSCMFYKFLLYSNELFRLIILITLNFNKKSLKRCGLVRKNAK